MAISNNIRGLIFAVFSSSFIGASFISKKKGLKRAGASGARAGFGGYTYLLEPLWWAGMVTSYHVDKAIQGAGGPLDAKVPKFPRRGKTALADALTTLVNRSAALAHFMLKERLQKLGVLGCVSCIVGSVAIVIHAPQEHTPNSMLEIWTLATQPAYLFYSAATISVVLILVLHFEPVMANKHTGLLGNMFSNGFTYGCKHKSYRNCNKAYAATLEGMSQIAYPQTWFFVAVAVVCVITQLNYLNKGLFHGIFMVIQQIYWTTISLPFRVQIISIDPVLENSVCVIMIHGGVILMLFITQDEADSFAEKRLLSGTELV